MSKPILFDPIESAYLVDEAFKIDKASTEPPKDAPSKEENVEALATAVAKLAKLQQKLYAHDRYSVLLVFQALDAAGKDGTIKAVLTGINPQGVQVTSFKVPSSGELDHDFMWRISNATPMRGRIGVFNRSHYEEVITLRVNPEYLAAEKLPHVPKDLDHLWDHRCESILAHEKHWAREGMVILKFFLHVSQKEQHRRFLDRLINPDDNWKFNAGDWRETKKWDKYMDAYQHALRTTSKPYAPWYSIPADSKSFMRRTVAEIVVGTLSQLKLEYPCVPDHERAELDKIRKELEAELGP
jgi:PPK2 family polyphosphate:nucleotide phosphotransferase